MAKRKTILGIPKYGQAALCVPSAPAGCSASESDGRCPACGGFLDVAQDNKDGTYIPKTLEEHQADRLLKPAMPTRNGKPVKMCPVCWKHEMQNPVVRGATESRTSPPRCSTSESDLKK